MNKNIINVLSGPTYSNGNPHLGTIANIILKDSINRFYNLWFNKKKKIILGFDNHGLPISNVILNKEKKIDKQYSEYKDILNFRNKCRNFSIIQSKNIYNIMKNFQLNIHSKSYYTTSLSYVKNIILLLKKIYNNNLLIKKILPINWCLKCKTCLSLAEIEEKQKTDTSIFVKIKLNLKQKKNIFIIIFTTKPWTLFFNQAIAYNDKLQYLIINNNNDKYIISEFFFNKYKNNLFDIFNQKIISPKKININDFFNNLQFKENYVNYKFPIDNFRQNIEYKNIIINSDKVNKFGSGFVHLSTDFGEDDFNICQNISLIKKQNILFNHENKSKNNNNNKYKINCMFFLNDQNEIINHNILNKNKLDIDNIKNLNDKIYKLLEPKKIILFKVQYSHIQSSCWRCKNILITKTSKEWFIDLNKLSNKINICFNNKINQLKKINDKEFQSEQIKFFKTLYKTIKNRKEWCLSRQRLWGTPLPSFICSKCNYIFINNETFNLFLNIKNFNEINNLMLYSFKYAKINNKIPIKYNILCPKCRNKTFFYGNTIDIWFDSGGSWFYFNKKINSNNSLLYIEGYDQFRGWFQSSFLTYISYHYKNTKLKELFPYKFLLCHGYIINSKKEKLSKSKNNYKEINFKDKNLNFEKIRTFILSSKYISEIKYSEQQIDNMEKQNNKFKRFIEKIIILINKNQINKKSKNYKYINNDKCFFFVNIFNYFFFLFFKNLLILKTYKFIHFLNIFIKKCNYFFKEYSDIFITYEYSLFLLKQTLNILIILINIIIPKTIKNLIIKNKLNTILNNNTILFFKKNFYPMYKDINLQYLIQKTEIIFLINNIYKENNSLFKWINFDNQYKSLLLKILNNDKNIKNKNLIIINQEKILNFLILLKKIQKKNINKKDIEQINNKTKPLCFFYQNNIFIIYYQSFINNNSDDNMIKLHKENKLIFFLYNKIQKFIQKQRQYISNNKKINIKKIIINDI